MRHFAKMTYSSSEDNLNGFNTVQCSAVQVQWSESNVGEAASVSSSQTPSTKNPKMKRWYKKILGENGKRIILFRQFRNL